jgi:hypothetical protein
MRPKYVYYDSRLRRYVAVMRDGRKYFVIDNGKYYIPIEEETIIYKSGSTPGYIHEHYRSKKDYQYKKYYHGRKHHYYKKKHHYDKDDDKIIIITK